MDKFLTASAFIIFDGKVLLHKHKKFNIWLPVGGHIEFGESPEEAVLREVREECGLEIELFNPDKNLDLEDAVLTIRPMYIITKPNNRKYDFVYFAKAKNMNIKVQENESGEFNWITREDIKSIETKPNVKVLCEEALKLQTT